MSTVTSITEVPIPSKWDIIPLHTSDRATFKSCRRRWFWSSPAHANLIPKATVYGIYKPFWFGTGVHHAIEKFYHPVLKEDPEMAFDAWYDLQWNGGIVKESELDQFADRSPQPTKDGLWEVKGLRDILPDPDEEEFENHHQIGLGMMRFYKEYAEREDDFIVVASEHQFSVPVIDPVTSDRLMMEDTREMPEDWIPNKEFSSTKIDRNGFSVTIKEVHARGRMDLIVYSERTDNFVIFDHKTVNSAIDDDYFEHTNLDEQVSTYIWAAELEAQIHDLPYKNIAGIVYQALRKAYPTVPTLLKNGEPSVNRQTECTTAYLFEKTIKDLGMEALFNVDEKMQAYYTYLVEKGDKQFIVRHPVVRNKHQKMNVGLGIYLEALDMLDNPRIYKNATKEFSCLRCAFRAPCIAVEAGYDYEGMLADGYETNHDR